MIENKQQIACRLWDIRALSERRCVATILHPKAVSSAVFSPTCGHKLLTTCGDNRLRVFEGLPWRVGLPTSTMVIVIMSNCYQSYHYLFILILMLLLLHWKIRFTPTRSIGIYLRFGQCGIPRMRLTGELLWAVILANQLVAWHFPQ